jgi:hypothetical protein
MAETKIPVPAKSKPLLTAAEMEKHTGMKMVFITASPVLTNEVRRFYGTLKRKLIYHLQQRDERILKRQQAQQTITEQETQSIIKEVMEE